MRPNPKADNRNEFNVAAANNTLRVKPKQEAEYDNRKRNVSYYFNMRPRNEGKKYV